MPARHHASQVLAVELIGFLAIIALSWANELFGLPSLIFGGGHRVNWPESVLETAICPFGLWLSGCASAISSPPRRVPRRSSATQGPGMVLVLDSWWDEPHYRDSFTPQASPEFILGKLTQRDPKKIQAVMREVCGLTRGVTERPTCACCGPSSRRERRSRRARR
jgi:hypothetical protein